MYLEDTSKTLSGLSTFLYFLKLAYHHLPVNDLFTIQIGYIMLQSFGYHSICPSSKISYRLLLFLYVFIEKAAFSDCIKVNRTDRLMSRIAKNQDEDNGQWHPL